MSGGYRVPPRVTGDPLPPAPVVRDFDYRITPLEAARRLQALPWMLLLDSAMPHDRLGRYSFVAADPVDCFLSGPGSAARTALDWLDRHLTSLQVHSRTDLPPFQGGCGALFCYEFGGELESLPRADRDDLPVPAVALALYDVVLAWDHVLRRAWLVSQGIPETGSPRSRRAAVRAEEFLNRLAEPAASGSNPVVPAAPLAPESLHPVDRFATLPDLASNFDESGYRDAIRATLQYIQAGDIFQANIAQRLLHPATAPPLELFASLQRINPAPFAGLFDIGPARIISASPERLASVRAGLVETRPVKGTRRRTLRPEVDLDTARQLQSSEKDRAENIMIVDLMRNDLSRICHDNSIEVTQLLGLETYASVLHLVSVIEGRYRKELPPGELVRALFPGGSVTGAPKIRAMEIISELEGVARGPYCGSLGYFSLDGSVDLNILIRTVTESNGWWQIPVGGGIVVDSDPDQEYTETWIKAAGMLQAIADSIQAAG